MSLPMTAWPWRALAVAACIGTVGCATPTLPPRTTVVLLPDEDGSVGEVTVRTPGGSQVLDRAFSAATVDAGASAPSGVLELGRDRIDATYRALLSAQPPQPVTFTLHFVLDKTVLTDESRALLPALLQAVRTRKPTEITIFGHADASGSEERNQKLAAGRAKAVADLLQKHDPTLDRIDVQSFGDKVPLFPSKSRGAEPRNRRAEVMIL